MTKNTVAFAMASPGIQAIIIHFLMKTPWGKLYQERKNAKFHQIHVTQITRDSLGVLEQAEQRMHAAIKKVKAQGTGTYHEAHLHDQVMPFLMAISSARDFISNLEKTKNNSRYYGVRFTHTGEIEHTSSMMIEIIDREGVVISQTRIHGMP